MEQIVGFRLHQGAMAVARIPPSVSVKELVTGAPTDLLLVALDGMANAENLGVVVRNCAAFGVRGLIVGETSSSPYLRRAVRNSIGTVFDLPIVRTSNLVATLNELTRHWSVQTIAAHPGAREETLAELEISQRCCIIFGSEAHGISEPVLKACSVHAAIPMASGVDSLNVASASSVFLYAASRSRRDPTSP
jgi:tRNA G18 (ribose-2'-O)-methylase SpoU